MKIKRILVTQPKPEGDKSPYFDLAKKYNTEVDFRPFIRIEGVSAKEFRASRINLADYTAVVLTSKNAVDHYFRMCNEMRVHVPETMKYFCISESTAYYLQKYVIYRKRKIFHGKQTFMDLIDVIKKHKEDKFLLPCSDIHKEEIADVLDEQGVQYTKAVIYKTIASDLRDVDIAGYDVIAFFSPAGVRALFKNFKKYKQGRTLIAAFGPTTSKAVEKAGLKLNIYAPRPAIPSMTAAIEEAIRESEKKK